MNVLITGSSGMVGRFVVEHLANKYDVTTLDRREPLRRDLPHINIDLLDLEATVENVRGFDAVVHLAGIPHPLNDPPERVFHVNTQGTFNVLEACGRNGIKRFIFMSSESTLGFAFSKTSMWPLSLPIDESHPLRPQDAYGLSKVTCEALCQGYSRAYEMSTIALRAPWIWVPLSSEVAFYRKLIDEYPVWRKNLWAYIHVDDVAEAIRLALETDTRPTSASMFICADENWTGHNSAELMTTFYPETRPHLDGLQGRQSIISNKHAAKMIGFRPQKSLIDLGLRSGTTNSH